LSSVGVAGFCELVPSTVEMKMSVLYWARFAAVVNGVVSSLVPPGIDAAVCPGSNTSTVKPLACPRAMTARVPSSMLEWRNPSVLPTTRTL
jgi:uncharacterized membrane protein YagU involved in acid resistance